MRSNRPAAMMVGMFVVMAVRIRLTHIAPRSSYRISQVRNLDSSSNFHTLRNVQNNLPQAGERS